MESRSRSPLFPLFCKRECPDTGVFLVWSSRSLCPGDIVLYIDLPAGFGFWTVGSITLVIPRERDSCFAVWCEGKLGRGGMVYPSLRRIVKSHCYDLRLAPLSSSVSVSEVL